MSAIVAALQSIPQLILTRESKLTKGEKQFLSQLDDILAPQGDHRAYRQALQNLKTPFVIPWLGAHFQPFITSLHPSLITNSLTRYIYSHIPLRQKKKTNPFMQRSTYAA